MLKLVTVFENAHGKNHRWTYNNPDPNKAPEKIKEALEAMTTLNLFQKDGVRQFCKVVSAKFVETIETPIFDLSQQAETYVADPDNAFAPFIIADEVTPVEEVKQIEEPKAVKPAETAAIEVDRKSALTTTEAAGVSKTVLEKAGIHSQAKATLDAMVAGTTTAKDPVVNPDSLSRAVAKEAEPEAIPAKAETEGSIEENTPVKKSTNPRKEKVDRLRAYHEANKKKKKGKKKKR
ncbi:DUF2922 domain-containing protein [Enterococcus sp. 669A]|uniref:DUF2922 domain-containing protein n=1 Tax=Candidatus Enterococcus moelleringii TaxID=2815325 RepID=A0ABS3L8U9_9ENTE|nr:DUF2922 domain-containing protein [Enterococcus sp. 669A]MBO1306032.1 DUF2922 domain-containing protein [Enterococcus sp. 669A]